MDGAASCIPDSGMLSSVIILPPRTGQRGVIKSRPHGGGRAQQQRQRANTQARIFLTETRRRTNRHQRPSPKHIAATMREKMTSAHLRTPLRQGRDPNDASSHKCQQKVMSGKKPRDWQKANHKNWYRIYHPTKQWGLTNPMRRRNKQNGKRK